MIFRTDFVSDNCLLTLFYYSGDMLVLLELLLFCYRDFISWRCLSHEGYSFPYARKGTKGAHKRNLCGFSYVSLPLVGFHLLLALLFISLAQIALLARELCLTQSLFYFFIFTFFVFGEDKRNLKVSLANASLKHLRATASHQWSHSNVGGK